MSKRMTIKDAQDAQDSHKKCQEEIHKVLERYMAALAVDIWRKANEKNKS